MIVQLRTEDGLEGVGEGPGRRPVRPAAALAARHVVGADPYHLEALRVLIGRPNVFSTIEVACLDLIGKATGRPVYDLLGGPARRRVPFAAYLFYKEAGDDEWGRALTPEELVHQAERFAEQFGMTVFKLKGGVLDPDVEVHTVKLLRERFGPSGWAAHRSERRLVGRDVDPRRRKAARDGPRIPRRSDRQHRGHGAGGAAYAASAEHQHVRHGVRAHPDGVS